MAQNGSCYLNLSLTHLFKASEARTAHAARGATAGLISHPHVFRFHDLLGTMLATMCRFSLPFLERNALSAGCSVVASPGVHLEVWRAPARHEVRDFVRLSMEATKLAPRAASHTKKRT